MGAAIARLFAQAGAASFAIVGRNQAKGASVAQQITAETGVPVHVIVADLACIADGKAAAGLPFGRLLDPAEVARAALWVVSADSGMMTGTVIDFDQSVWGGYDGQAPTPAQPLA